MLRRGGTDTQAAFRAPQVSARDRQGLFGIDLKTWHTGNADDQRSLAALDVEACGLCIGRHADELIAHFKRRTPLHPPAVKANRHQHPQVQARSYLAIVGVRHESLARTMPARHRRSNVIERDDGPKLAIGIGGVDAIQPEFRHRGLILAQHPRRLLP